MKIRTWALIILLQPLMTEAHAFGLQESVNRSWGNGYLFAPAYSSRLIRYCLEIGDLNRFPDASMNAQVQGAIKMWLRAVPEANQTLADVVQIERVSCGDTQLNLKVLFKPEMQSAYANLKAYQVADWRNGHYFSQVVVDSAIRTGRGTFVDTLELIPSMHGNPLRLIEFFDSNPYDLELLAKVTGVESLQLFWSTYRVLIHEIGHSFGLCDTYGNQVEYCDPYFKSSSHGESAMKTSYQFYLSDEDITGIRTVAELYRTGRMAGYVKSLPFRKPKLKVPAVIQTLKKSE